MCEQFVSRQELLRNPSVAELCINYYYDPKTKIFKLNKLLKS